MVEDRVTDGKRIAQLLASELTGRSSGPLARLDVADADTDAEPSPDGTYAYAIVRDGERVGAVFVHDAAARIDLASGSDAEAWTDEGDGVDGLAVTTTGDGQIRIRVEYGAATKRVVDLLVSILFET